MNNSDNTVSQCEILTANLVQNLEIFIQTKGLVYPQMDLKVNLTDNYKPEMLLLSSI